jgi:hypothetical protein
MSKTLRVLVAVALLSCAHPAKAGSDGRWLVREAPRFQRADHDLYHAIVSSVFSDSSDQVGGCLQMVSLVGGEVEEMVYVQCDRGTSAAPMRVVHLVATESIAQTLREKGPVAALEIDVRRAEATITLADFETLRKAWLHMLALAETETGSRQREQLRDHYFSAQRPGWFQGKLGGVAKSPPAASPAGALVELGHLLAQAAGAGDIETREKLMTRIRERATAISRFRDNRRADRPQDR